MGRYLDLVQDQDAAASPEPQKYDINDQRADDRDELKGLRSYLSYLSYPETYSADDRLNAPTEPEPQGSERTSQLSSADTTETTKTTKGGLSPGGGDRTLNLDTPVGGGDIETRHATNVEYGGGAAPQVEDTPSESALLASGIWFDRFGPPGEPPFDEPCPSRRGRIERQGRAFLHFCVTCGAWGAFGYGVTGRRPGRWYCGQHRPKDEM
jgi:hypothetical protein